MLKKQPPETNEKTADTAENKAVGTYRTINGKTLLHQLKSSEKFLKNNKILNENHLFERELKELIKTAPEHYFTLKNGQPRLGEAVLSLKEINDATVSELIYTLSQNRYVKEEELNSLIWQSKWSVISAALKDTENPLKYTKMMYDIKELDKNALEELSPLHQAFLFDEVYKSSSRETRALYRSRAAQISRLTGIEERQYTGEVVKRAILDDSHVGAVIEDDYRNIYPFHRSALYISLQLILALLLSLGTGLLTRLWVIPLVFLPFLGIIKPLFDLTLSRFSHSGALPRVEIKDKLPLNGQTVCVMSALVSDEESIRDALSRLKTAKLKNPAEGIFFTLLCDLPPSDSETELKDREIFRQAGILRQEIFPESSLIIRKRRYSKTQRKYQGFDRKRGAIEELVRYMNEGDSALSAAKNSENPAFSAGNDFYYISGNIEALKDCQFITALDLDTVPLMDSIKELAAIALHPLNKDYGIIAPRCTSTLDSTLKTPFARAMAGNGGVSGISSYDSFCGEFYFDGFGEGIFCGKGLIRKDAFLKDCCGKFPPERVLSHDVLEGGLTGVAYAGDVEFSDSFPPSSKSYFKRAHRWIRGDFQNFRFLFRKDFSPLTKFKLFDNIRRGLDPLLLMSLMFLSVFVHNGFVLGIVAYLGLLLPYIPPLLASLFRGLSFGLKRRFYSPIVSESKQLLLAAVMGIMTLPKAALITLDALCKTLWRCIVTKRQLLQWTTSGFLERTAFKGGYWHLLPPLGVALALMFCCVYFGSGCAFPAALLMCAAFPFLVCADRPRSGIAPSLSGGAKAELFSQTEKMWGFYADFVTEENSHLPPDNVQFSPVYRVCRRTSPTNIGMYLLSAAAVYQLGIISGRELVQRVEKTVETIEKLPKWRGNLFNWYELGSLKVVSGFVSSVDSGNFLCCLIAVKECIRLGKLSPQLCGRIEELIKNTRLSEFFVEKHMLFSIGFDTEKGELSPHRYDMLMSEARLLSYAAIALGQAPKAHWRALSRTMSRSGAYSGAMAWTGTMFEFFMPELLLTSKEGSMSYEALKFAFHCQKHFHTPFGISESGYYAFDSELNYQYKAHGVQKNALKGGMDRECVVSPYSSYLTLSMEPLESFNNLRRLEREGAWNNNYGFYEAVDYTRWRVGGKAVIKSHMAHHVGMSIAGAANLLKGNICSRLFLSDSRMKRAEELTEEKVMAGEKILKTSYHYSGEKNPKEAWETDIHTLENSPVNPLCGGSLNLFLSANGLFCGNYKGKETVYRTFDRAGGLNRPHGSFYGFCGKEAVYPLFYRPELSNKLSAVFTQSSAVYKTGDKGLELEMEVRARDNTELRTFKVRNKSRSGRQLTLCAYSEPVLAAARDYSAHPMFMDLFLKLEYDKESKLFIISRKERDGDNVTACAAGFIEEGDFTYCLSKEECTDFNPLSFFKRALIRENVDNSVPSPCLFIKNDITVDSGGECELTLFYCYGDSVKEVKEKAKALRKNGADNEEYAPSPLSLLTLHGQTAARALPSMLYGEAANDRVKKARSLNTLDRRALWQFGISGDFPLLTVTPQGISSALLLKQGLERCGVRSDLVVLCENGLEKGLAISEIGGNGFALIRPELPPDILNLIYALSAVNGDPEPIKEKKDKPKKPILPILPSTHPQGESEFTDEGFIVRQEENIRCNILANPQFGTLMSQNSLGFTWALNSRENKLTPWENDPIADNCGEMLLLKCGNVFYDLIRGSEAEFTPSYCLYRGNTPNFKAETKVQVYTKGLGKELSVKLTNDTDAEQSVSLVYRVVPVLGDKAEMSMPTAYTQGECIVLENPQNPYFKGAAALYCSKKAQYIFSEEELRTGDFSGAKEAVQPNQKENSPITAVVVPLKLPPRENLRIRFILGYCDEAAKAAEYVKSMEGSPCGAETENSFTVSTPDGKLNRLFNTWLPHQALACRLWGRTGFYQNGGGYGFRDQLQDCLAIMYFSPQIALEHILLCCGSQFSEGDVLHWWHTLNGKRVGVRTKCSDDLLWLPFVCCEYAKSFGAPDFWDSEIEYISGGEIPQGRQELFLEAEYSGTKESVFDHCKKAMEKGFNKGKNGLLKIGSGDWNDGYDNVGAEGQGESVWLTMFYIMCAKSFAPVARQRSEGAFAEELEKQIAELSVATEEFAWDGDRYIRAFYDDGSKMGARGNGACEIDILPQAFAVLCGLPDQNRSITALNTAWEQLVDKKNGIIKLFNPAFSYENTKERPGYIISYPEGVRENGGQYTHAAVWYCMACFKAGQTDRAVQLLNMLNPAYKDGRFGREPYFMTADIYTNMNCYGRGGWSMYTGAAAWYWKCIFEGLLGGEVKGGKVSFNGSLPEQFEGSKVECTVGGEKVEAVYSGGWEKIS